MCIKVRQGKGGKDRYECLFAAVSETLTEFAANPQHLGGEAAFSLILHTWQQDLGRHVHLHALVAGGALTKDGEWRAPKRGFLFPVKALSTVFRGKFMERLDALRSKDGWRADAQLPPLHQRGFARSELSSEKSRGIHRRSSKTGTNRGIRRLNRIGSSPTNRYD